MSTKKVTVKWNKQVFNIDVDTSDKPALLKSQLYSLSGVVPERQKILMKGRALKSDENWENFIISDGATLLMLGSADNQNIDAGAKEILKEKVIFEEDVSEAKLAKLYDLPPGIINLGNTCYMNAVLQCLFNVPPLKHRILNYKSQSSNRNENFLNALKQLFSELGRNPTDFIPILFLKTFHETFPDFGELENAQSYRQQDANECLVRVREILAHGLKEDPSNSVHFMDKYFRGSFDVQLTLNNETFVDNEKHEYDLKASNALNIVTGNVKDINNQKETSGENGEKDKIISTTHEDFFQLRCFIDTDVKYLHTGLQKGLSEEIEKFSPELNRNALYTKHSEISRLPAYLIVQFERFSFSKQTGKSAKKLREVKFPITLDLFDFCTANLREKLQAMRKAYKLVDEINLRNHLNAHKKDDSITDLNQPSLKNNGETGVATKNIEPTLGASKVSSMTNTAVLKRATTNEELLKLTSFPDDEGSNNSGYYDLNAVLTHQGRTLNSGHYIAWVKRNDIWYKCDDNDITPVTEEHILKLAGGGKTHVFTSIGLKLCQYQKHLFSEFVFDINKKYLCLGDWHMAYVLLYGPHNVPPAK